MAISHADTEIRSLFSACQIGCSFGTSLLGIRQTQFRIGLQREPKLFRVHGNLGSAPRSDGLASGDISLQPGTRGCARGLDPGNGILDFEKLAPDRKAFGRSGRSRSDGTDCDRNEVP